MNNPPRYDINIQIGAILMIFYWTGEEQEKSSGAIAKSQTKPDPSFGLGTGFSKKVQPYL